MTTAELCPHTVTDISGRRWKCTRAPHDVPAPVPGRNPSHGGAALFEADRHYMVPVYAASKRLRD